MRRRSSQHSAISTQPGNIPGSPGILEGAQDVAIRKFLEGLARKPFEKCEGEWRALLRQVRLGLIYAVPIGDVLREGRWREKKNPLGYVKQAGKRMAIRMGLVDRPRRRDREVLACDLNYTQWDSDELGREPGHDEKLEMAQHEYARKHVVFSRRSLPVDRVHRAVLTKDLEVDWELVADLAGMDDAETMVMMQRAMGLTREMALKGCNGAADRRILKAAWRRFDRDRKLIRKVLETGRKQRDLHDEGAPKMLFLLEDDGGLKIFFAGDVPEVAVAGT